MYSPRQKRSKAKAEMRRQAAELAPQRMEAELLLQAKEEEERLAGLALIRDHAEAESQQRAERGQQLNDETEILHNSQNIQLKRIDLVKAQRLTQEETLKQLEADARQQAEQEEARLAQLHAVRDQAQLAAEKRAETEQHLNTEIEALRILESEQLKSIEDYKARLAQAEMKAQQRAEQEQKLNAELEALDEAETIQLRQLAELEKLRSQVEAATRARTEREEHIKAEIRVLRNAEPEHLAQIENLEAEIQAARAEVSRIAAEEKERRSTLEVVAKAELEARRQAEHEQRRVCELEAQRVEAEAELKHHVETEQQRLADLEAMRARAEAKARQRAEREKQLRAQIEMLRQVEARQVDRIQRVEMHLRSQEESAQQSGAGSEDFVSSRDSRKFEKEIDLVSENLVPAAAGIEPVAGRPTVPAGHFAVTRSDKSISLIRSDTGIESVREDLSSVSAAGARLESGDATERSVALAELAYLGEEESVGLIAKSFDDSSVEVRNAGARALYDLKPDRAASFTRALRDATTERRRRIGSALASSGLAASAINCLAGESREVTYDAFTMLFLMAKAGEVQPLIETIENHENIAVRLAVIKLLAFCNQSGVIAAFRRLAVRGSLPAEVRSAVMEAIHEISIQDRQKNIRRGNKPALFAQR